MTGAEPEEQLEAICDVLNRHGVRYVVLGALRAASKERASPPLTSTSSQKPGRRTSSVWLTPSTA